MEVPVKITHNKVGQNLNLTDASKADKSGKAKGNAAATEALLTGNTKPTPDDSSKVNLSERAMDIKKAKSLATAAPDIREDRVAELQKKIDQGKYKVDAKEIANKMVDEELQWS